MLVAVPFALAYLAFSPHFAGTVNAGLELFFIASLIIFLTYAGGGFSAIITAKYPHKMAGYDVVLSVSRVVFFLLLVWLIKIRALIGLLIAVTLACLASFFYVVGVSMRDVKGSLDLGRAKRWLKLSWMVLYRNLSLAILVASDRYILGMLGFRTELGYYSLAHAVALSLGVTSVLVYALYPKILSVGLRDEDVKEAFKLCLSLTIPATIGCMILAPSILYVLGGGEKFIGGTLSLRILSPAFFLFAVWTVPDYAIMGEEKVEEYGNMKSVIKSRFFALFSCIYVTAMVFVPLLYFLSNVYGITGCASVMLLWFLAIFLIKFYLAFSGRVKRVVSPSSVAKFTLASLVMAIVVSFLPPPERLTSLLTVISIGAMSYFLVLLSIDKWSLNLVRVTLREIRSSFRG